jgi:hypothetical protein
MRSTKPKSYKEKIKELKDISTGKKTIDELIKANQPARVLHISKRRKMDGEEIYYPDLTGLYSDVSDDQGMSKEQYEAWLSREREKGPISHILQWVSDDRNEPIIDDED